MNGDKRSATKWLAEVWTGSGWLTLNIYRTEAAAQRRVSRSKSKQEHRVRIMPDRETHHESNVAGRTARERREINAKY